MRGKVSRLYISEAQGHQVCGVRSEGGKEEARGKVNRFQGEGERQGQQVVRRR